MAAKAPSLPADQTLVEHSYTRGLVRDSNDIPAGGLYDVVDFLVEEPGLLYKRGGWGRQSALGAGAPKWVGALTYIANLKIVGISQISSGGLHLFDVTTASAVDVGAIAFAPQENSAQYIDMLILCAPNLNLPPMKVSAPGGVTTLAPLGGLPPAASFSVVYGGRIVLGRIWGHPERLMFSELPLVEGQSFPIASATSATKTFTVSGDLTGLIQTGRSFNVTGSTGNNGVYTTQSAVLSGGVTSIVTVEPIPSGTADGQILVGWDPLKYLDTSFPITGLGTVMGTLIIFSAHHTERIIGAVPPAETGSDMQLQSLAGVGCLDARSIVNWGETLIFAGEEGVWSTNGAGVDSLTEKPDGTGIQAFWRSLFPRDDGPSAKRQIVAGLFNRDFYLVCILDNLNAPIETLMLHIPSQAWTRVSNTVLNSMCQGLSAHGVLDLYGADAKTPYVNKLTDMLRPNANNSSDADGTVVEPTFTTRQLDGGSSTLKAYGFGRLTFSLFTIPPFATLTVTRLSGYGMSNAKDLDTFGIDAPNNIVQRHRFQCFGDFQTVAFKVKQKGPTLQTNIFFLEVESRTYAPGADFDFREAGE